ncbi:hypothetical protein DSO57_1010243 [Entomophthora muscae]|uniref:Uncharacterized protein n=1 Tax=Entomophthora muscae TaxID=34485 RepID=A0ACC2RXS2_9FUNG|nr:hypothetical protein DSO57_1010243 [Entomophthora muscae]
MIPETCKIECEPIYAADSLTLSQMKVFLMYLFIIFCCTFPYSLFKGYHLQSIFAVVFFPLLYTSFAKIEITQPRCTLLSRLKFWQPAPSLPSPSLNTAREILALTEEWTQHGFPQKLLSFLLKQAEPESCEWCLPILDQAPNSFDDVSILIPLVTCQAPATYSLIDYKTLFSSSQGCQPLPLNLKQFQANAKKLSLPESAKLAALHLSLDHTGQSLSPWLHPSASVSDMIQRLLEAVGAAKSASVIGGSSHEPATPQGPISPEVSQSLVTPAPALAIAPVISSPPQSIPTLAVLFFYNIYNSSATLANLNSIDFQAPTSGNATNACKLIRFNQNCPLLSAKAQAIVDLHVATMNKVAPAPCIKPIVIEPVIDQPFVALNEDLLSIQTAPQLQVQVDSNHPPLSNKTNMGYFLFHCSFASTSHLTKAVALVDTGATDNLTSKDLVEKLGLEYNPGALCKGGVSNVFCSFRLRCPLSFSITDNAFVADFTVAKHLTYLVILGVE